MSAQVVFDTSSKMSSLLKLFLVNVYGDLIYRGVAQPGPEHSLGVREIGRSNRLTPTISKEVHTGHMGYRLYRRHG